MAAGRVGVRTAAIRVHVHFIAYDRAARLCLVQSAPLEQTGQGNVNFLVHLEVASEDFDLLRVALTALGRCTVQGFGELDHYLYIIASSRRRTGITRGGTNCPRSHRRRRRRCCRGSCRSWLFFKRLENSCTKPFRFGRRMMMILMVVVVLTRRRGTFCYRECLMRTTVGCYIYLARVNLLPGMIDRIVLYSVITRRLRFHRRRFGGFALSGDRI